jgi:hypothetical protein
MTNSSQQAQATQVSDQEVLLMRLNDEIAALRQQVAEQHAEIERLLLQIRESCCPWSHHPWHRGH